ncbi:MAG: hypothetical protein JXR25_17535 [Pontiellaceae bacterium]|nr:hypothetical protein [Pontiellaceae bacterium]MBN2786623.1 hypothetical protein [Pontiellaceae bacterium]
MKLILILFGMMLSACAWATPDELFQQAQQAYDAENYEQAVEAYESLLAAGISNLEVYYNLANARFRAGDLPEAVQGYRNAWYRNPHDADISANLKYALNAAGAVEPAPPIITRALTALSSQEWMRLGLGAYILLAVLLISAFLLRSGRNVLFRICLLPVGLLLLSGTGWWQWNSYTLRPEAVVSIGGTTARFGPTDGATSHFKLPEGALVRETGKQANGWKEVKYDAKHGWVKQENLLLLSP